MEALFPERRSTTDESASRPNGVANESLVGAVAFPELFRVAESGLGTPDVNRGPLAGSRAEASERPERPDASRRPESGRAGRVESRDRMGGIRDSSKGPGRGSASAPAADVRNSRERSSSTSAAGKQGERAAQMNRTVDTADAKATTDSPRSEGASRSGSGPASTDANPSAAKAPTANVSTANVSTVAASTVNASTALPADGALTEARATTDGDTARPSTTAQAARPTTDGARSEVGSRVEAKTASDAPRTETSTPTPSEKTDVAPERAARPQMRPAAAASDGNRELATTTETKGTPEARPTASANDLARSAATTREPESATSETNRSRGTASGRRAAATTGPLTHDGDHEVASRNSASVADKSTDANRREARSGTSRGGAAVQAIKESGKAVKSQNAEASAGKAAPALPTEPAPTEGRAPSQPAVPATTRTAATGRVGAPTSASGPPTANPVIFKVVPGLENQIAAKAKEFLAKGRTELRIRLDPPSLGKLRIKLELSDGQAVARILVSSPEAAAMLAKDREDLIRAFQNQGFDRVDVQIGPDDGSTANSRDDEPEQEDGPRDGSAASTDRNVRPLHRAYAPASPRGVDLFV